MIKKLLLGIVILIASLCSAQTYDQYGGINELTVGGCNPTTAYFTVQLLTPSNHWAYVDPSCHVFPRFGVDLTGPDTTRTYWPTRYSSDYKKWYTHTAQRLWAYYFNEWGDYSDESSAAQGPLPGTNPIPMTIFMRPIGYALFNLSNCNNAMRTYSGNLKDFQAQDASHNPLYISSLVWGSPGWNFHPGPYPPSCLGCGQTPDVYDPYAIGDCADWQINVAKSYFPSHDFYNNRNVVDISLEDADFVYSWRGSGNDGYPHTGYLAAVVNPYVPTGSTDCGTGNCGTGTTFWTKAAWACGGWQHSAPTTCDGTSYLELHYGTVAAVCASWGLSPCPYTTFGSLSGGWGVGDGAGHWGLMDEDGMNGPIGHLAACHNALDISGCPTNFQTDVNNMLYNEVLFAVNTMVAHAKAYDPNHVISALDFLGGESATSDIIRTPVLQALRDSNVQILHAVFATNRISSSSAMMQNIYNTTHKPIMPWYHVCAPADSPYSSAPGHSPPYGACGDGSYYSTQALRGAAYASNVTTMYSLQGGDGHFPIMQLNWWAWQDPCNATIGNPCNLTASGGQEWGLSTWSDNIYNGICAVIGASTDPWGYPCGGEAGNYGDFLDAVKTANYGIATRLIADQGSPVGLGEKATVGKVKFIGKIKF